MILPKDRDRRFVTIRRGGTLTDSAPTPRAVGGIVRGHVLDRVESVQPEDPRPRQAIEQVRAWVRGAGQAAAVAHVAAHELGAAAYAIKAARAAAATEGEGEGAGRLECRWQHAQRHLLVGVRLLGAY